MSKLSKKIGFIGAGNMGEAMINGLIRSGSCEPRQIWATDVRAARLKQLEDRYGINTSQDNRAVLPLVDVVVLAVKPQHMDDMLSDLAGCFPRAISGVKLVISIAAGYPISRVEKHLYRNLDESEKALLPIIRVMPNTPALVLSGMAGMTANRYAGDLDLADARGILEAVGKVIVLGEKDLDGVTALSGSGPAYVFYFIEALVEAGAGLGLRPSHAMTLTVETLKGAVKLLEETGETPSSLREKVTSKGGTTEAALKVLASGQVKENIVSAVRAAAKRSRELSEG